MMASDFIVDVSESDFEYQVLAYSQKVPVVVDFWAEWCAPCRMLGPLLERLAQEAQGGFRLAKLNVDDNPNLAIRYAVYSIPAVKAFRDGKMVAEFTGAQPEGRVREFLRSFAPSQVDLTLEKGFSLLEAREAKQAESAFRSALQSAPENSAARLGLAKSLLQQGSGAQAHALLVGFPASREFGAAETLLPLAQALLDLEENPDEGDQEPLEASFSNALRLARRGNLEAAMDGLLDILREDRHFRDGAARKVLVALLELLGESDPLTRQYRAELASVLF
jgi:putative thioredoxin